MSKHTLELFAVLVAMAHVPAAVGQTLVYSIPVPPTGTGFYTMAPIGDVNGDGRTDLIAGGLGNGQHEFARVYSGANGQLLFDLQGSPPNILFGAAVCGLKDVNGDGHDEFVVTAPEESITNVGQGRVTVYSGLDGSVLFSSIGVLVADWLGGSVADVGDVDGDGKHDIAAGMTAFNGVNGHDAAVCASFQERMARSSGNATGVGRTSSSGAPSRRRGISTTMVTPTCWSVLPGLPLCREVTTPVVGSRRKPDPSVERGLARRPVRMERGRIG